MKSFHNFVHLVWFEPTCVQKADKPFLNQKKQQQQLIDFISPNIIELEMIERTVNNKDECILDEKSLGDLHLSEMLDIAVDKVQKCGHTFRNIFVTLGKHGVLLCTSNDEKFTDTPTLNRKFVHFAAVNDRLLPIEVKSVSGAGDRYLMLHLLTFCIRLIVMYTNFL